MIHFPKTTSSYLVPAGTHAAVCYLVAELGTQETNFGKKPQIHLGWELPEERLPNGKVAVVSRRYAMSADPKSSLRSDLEGWEGRRFSPIDLDSFNIGDMVGRTCLLSVQHSDEVGGRIYANVISVMPPPRGTAKRAQTENDPVVFELADPDSRAVYGMLPEFLKTAISRSSEYQERFPALTSTREALRQQLGSSVQQPTHALILEQAHALILEHEKPEPSNTGFHDDALPL
jgi:hypothetical protein